MADALKAEGNKLFAEKKFAESIEKFSQAIELDPSNHVLYSNRSGAYASLKDWQKALEDANKVTEIKPDWAKGWGRKGTALHGEGDLVAATEAFEEALKLDPSNAQAKSGLDAVKRAVEAEANDSGAGLGGMFSDPNMIQKLAANPKTAALLGDAEFMSKLQQLQKNPNMAGAFMQDPRFLQVMSVLLGIDMSFGQGPGAGGAGDAGAKEAEEDVEMPDARPAPSQPKKEPEPEPEPEPVEESEEDRAAKKAKAEADELKKKGTEFYKKRQFDEAIENYNKAWETHKDITYKTNLGAAKFEKGDYEGCIQACNEAVEYGREILADFKIIAKAFARIGTAYEKMGDLGNAITYYQKAQTEHRTPEVLAKLRAAEKAKVIKERESYINPEEAEKARELGNAKFKESNWPEAVEAYSEMIKRAPDDPRGYSNRAACFIKLLEFPSAVQDCAKPKTWETTVERVESWPEEARPLKKHTWLSYLYGIGDLLLVLLPVYFILLGSAAASLHGKPTKDNGLGTKVEFAMDLGPTIFPIVFAAICGRSMKMIARFLAEKGAKISTLELLMASQSVWGTFESQLLMQRLTIVGANLLFLWALSPLGGQASLRLMSREHEASYTSTKLRYLTTGPAGAMFPAATSNFQRSKYAEAGALYNAALLAPLSVKLGPQDSWGNVKIPRLDALNQSNVDADGWLEVPSQMQVPEIYSSLVGVPIAGLPTNTSNKLTLEYNYLSVKCGPFDQQPYPGTHGTGDPGATNYTRLDEMVPGQIWWNKSQPDLQPFDTLGGRASFLIDTARDLARPPPTRQRDRDLYLGRLDGFIGHYNQSRLTQAESKIPRELTFASVYGISKDGTEQGLNIAKCDLFQHHVEASIQCAGIKCATSKVRNSTTDTRPTALTAFEYFVIMEAFAKEFPTAIKFNEGSSPTELFMANTSTFPFIQKAGRLFADEFYTNLSVLPPDLFSKRLSLVFNTYYQLSSQSSGYFGSLTGNLSAYGPDTLPVTDANVYLPANLSATTHSIFDWIVKFQQTVTDSNSPFLGATTTANTTSTEEIFVCNFAWLTLLLTASLIILITGGVAVILKRKTLGPEMFGFVTSMTYENPWLNIPQGGTMLDAMERARLLKDVEVHVADVHGNDNVGHIALAAGVPMRKLERERLYC